MQKLTIADLDLHGKCVLVRVDFNVPLHLSDKSDYYEVTDDTRIRAALPTINAVTKSGGKAILLSHLGRPKGQPEERFSLAPVADQLGQILDTTVRFSSETVGSVVAKTIRTMPNGTILLLENTRYFSDEITNDPSFASDLADLGDMYINDAFGTAHRSHASNVGVAAHFPDLSAAGYLLEKELLLLGNALQSPSHPMVALIGGAKVSDKMGVIANLSAIVDHILIGGAMAYTFLMAKGIKVGKSLVEKDRIDDALELIDIAGDKLHLPSDHIVSTSLDSPLERQTVTGEIEDDNVLGVDIGPQTIATYTDLVGQARTCIWNGPMGVFEVPEYAAGTTAMAQAVASATDHGAVTIVGGGDSVAAIKQSHLQHKVTHVSTGGGAMLKFLEGKTLPGVDALTDR
ncbi:MAG: phosphoglycerate kinase [Bacteroidetes bacterium]|nr:phosphoglycerate kinase [Bacteroidota bacterium]